MKIYCCSDLPIPASVINSNVDGIALTIKAANLFGFMGNGYNGSFMSGMKKTIRETNKEFSIGIIFGSECGNVIQDNFPCLSFIYKHHRNPANEPKPIVCPVPHNPDYLNKVEDTINWFASEVKKDVTVYNKITAIKATGDNETSLEMKNTVTDFTGTNDQFEAYYDAGIKWAGAGYTPAKGYDCNVRLVRIFRNNFSDKKVVLPYIEGLNGFPCVNEAGEFVKPKLRTNTTLQVLDYGKQFSNFYPQTTIFKADSITSDKYVQCNELFYNSATLAEYQAMIDHAKALGIEYLEIHPQNIFRYSSVFK